MTAPNNPQREPSLDDEWTDYDDSEQDDVCPECLGDGGDKWNDYALPCPRCDGDGKP